MVLLKLFVLCHVFLISVEGMEIKREKRTVDLFLRGFGDAFGYDVIRRVSSPQLRQVASTPAPTFFPPAVGPLPSGSYSRIILQLQQQQQQQQRNQQEEQNALLSPNVEPISLPQGAIVLPVASFVSAGVVPQPAVAPQVMVPAQEISRQVVATTAKPEVQINGFPWRIVGLAPVVEQGRLQAQMAPQNQKSEPAPMSPQATPSPAAQQAAPSPSNQQAAPSPSSQQAASPQASQQAAPSPPSQQAAPAPESQPQATFQQSPQGFNISFDSGPTRLNLFDSPRSEAISRSFNFNLNWNRNDETVTSAALVQPPEVSSTTAAAPRQSAALLTQVLVEPQQAITTPAPQIENFEIVPAQVNQPSQRQLNANFRQSVKKFWESSPWSEGFRSEDGREQDNAQNYFDEVPAKSNTEDVQGEERNEEPNEGSSDEAKDDNNLSDAPPRRSPRLNEANRREKKSSDFDPDSEEKRTKGYYKKFLVSRRPRDIGYEGYEPITTYTKDSYDVHDVYDKDFSYTTPETKVDEEDHEMFDVDSEIPKKSKVRTKETKKGFNVVQITKKTKVVKE